ncbi:hypothetical protein [Streptomyces sp. AcE210]|uniref:hypothetical protein n=1 Tax=Streptomyces sp. AcE210 TaxID=2292703 RepID=UPI001404A4AE|nr:hypothetical protein [Streptomyces sp. AcE210]
MLAPRTLTTAPSRVPALTPDGDDDVCHLQMEVDPIATLELREAFNALHAALVV